MRARHVGHAALTVAGCMATDPEPAPEPLSAPAIDCLSEGVPFGGDDPLSVTVDWSPTGDYLLAGSLPHLHLLAVEPDGTLTPRARFDGHGDRVYVRWSPDGHAAATGSDDGVLRLLRVEVEPPSLELVTTFTGFAKSVYTVAWSPDGRQLLTGTEDGRVGLFDVDVDAGTLEIVDLFEGHTDKVFTVAWSPDGTRALSASADDTLRLLAVDGGVQELFRLDGDEDFVPIAWSPDGTMALTGGWGRANDLYLLAVAETHLTVVQTVAAHRSGSRVVVWSPHSPFIFTGDHDHVVHLFDFDGELHERGILPDERIGVHDLGLSPDGTRLARASSRLDRYTVLAVDCDPLDP